MVDLGDHPPCEVSGCDRRARSKVSKSGFDYCSYHYNNWVTSGKVTPGPSKPLKGVAKGKMCSVEDCGEKVRCVGLCSIHYSRARAKKDKHPCPQCGQPTKFTSCKECFLKNSDKDYQPDADKTCSGCGETKKMVDFGWRKSESGKTKVRSRCRSCESRFASEYTKRLGKEEVTRRKRAWETKKRERIASLSGEEKAKALAREAYRGIRVSARTLGLSVEEVLAAFEKNGNVCEVCSWVPERTPDGKNKRVSIDHDHETGEFRGFLCSDCNLKLGHLEASIKSGVFRGLVDYAVLRVEE